MHQLQRSWGFDPSIRRHSGIWGAADEAVLNIERKKIFFFNPPQKYLKKEYTDNDRRSIARERHTLTNILKKLSFLQRGGSN